MLYKLYSSGGAWLEAGTLCNALQHVRREGRCEEVREDMVPRHHPAYSAPPDTSQHGHPGTPPGTWVAHVVGFPDFFTLQTSHLPSQRTCCRALYSVPASNHAPPELYSLYSIIQRCILYSYTAYTLYDTGYSTSYTITLCKDQVAFHSRTAQQSYIELRRRKRDHTSALDWQVLRRSARRVARSTVQSESQVHMSL